jgi:hypothetical protein
MRRHALATAHPWEWAAATGHEFVPSFLPRIALRKKRDVPGSHPAKRALATAPWGHYVSNGIETGKIGVSQSFVQLIGYVVLAAIVLAVGFGAIGAPPLLPGAF